MEDLKHSDLSEKLTYHTNGNLKERAFFRNGKLEGEYKWWYRNGQIYAHKFFRNGNWKENINYGMRMGKLQ